MSLKESLRKIVLCSIGEVFDIIYEAALSEGKMLGAREASMSGLLGGDGGAVVPDLPRMDKADEPSGSSKAVPEGHRTTARKAQEEPDVDLDTPHFVACSKGCGGTTARPDGVCWTCNNQIRPLL